MLKYLLPLLCLAFPAEASDFQIETAGGMLPGWVSLLPPLLAIGVALLFRQVVPALFLGIWVGSWAVSGFSFTGVLTGLLDSFQVHVLGAMADADHAAIILFSLMIGGMVGIISANGGMKGIVEMIVKRGANTARRGQLATALMGLLIFFDDYANSLVVGNTMRPITDKLRISREKLAYIVDSTAAPLACIAIITTWVGYEVGLIGDAVKSIDGLDEPAFAIFLKSVLYNFYPILALFFVFLVARTGRDFGPMLQAEKLSRKNGEIPEMHRRMAMTSNDMKIRVDGGSPNRARLAILPIGVLTLTVLIGLYVTGEGETTQEILSNFDSYKALMWGSLMGVLAALALTVGYRSLSLDDALNAWSEGVKSMAPAMIILVLAWSLSSITQVLHTADYLVSILGETLPVELVPVLVFLIAAATGFATGTSWGAMGILVPLVVPLAWAIMGTSGMQGPEGMHILYSSVACILGGAVWGDHCSPISDTTVLSSMASGCDHVAHVRTQLPYAMMVGAVAVLAGTIPAAFGAPWWALLVISAGMLVVGLRILGREAETA
ncbi:MAG: Na+/H+ antiporter NhaC family protein [Sphingomonadales bacterium]